MMRHGHITIYMYLTEGELKEKFNNKVLDMMNNMSQESSTQ